MSLRTRVRGLTAWVNFRLQQQHQHQHPEYRSSAAEAEPISSVLADLLAGSTLPNLVLSLTGNLPPRFGTSFDGMSDQQKLTRLQMAIDELKKRNLLPDELDVDVKRVATRSANHVFDLLWRLISNDIRFLASRADFLRLADDLQLCQVNFRFVPEPVPPPKKRQLNVGRNLAAGFGASASFVKPNQPGNSAIKTENETERNYVPYPNAEIMTSFSAEQGRRPNGLKSSHKVASSSNVSTLLLDVITKQLKTVVEGKDLECKAVADLANVRVICALINSFVPNLLPTELFLNDRWAINEALRTAERMFKMTASPFDVEDLVEGNSTSVCSYFCSLVACAYCFRQSAAVARTVDELRKRHRHSSAELALLPSEATEMHRFRKEIDQIDTRLKLLASVFDVEFCVKWHADVERLADDFRRRLRRKISQKYDEVVVPRDIEVRELIPLVMIDLSMTDAEHGYYLMDNAETMRSGRKLILYDRKTETYLWQKSVVRRFLHLCENAEAGSETALDPSDFHKFRIYADAVSGFKKLKSGTQFLYQIFPHELVSWNQLLLAAIRRNDSEACDRITTFFDNDENFINEKVTSTNGDSNNGGNSKNNAGDTALHVACRLGRFDMVGWLLERGADVNCENYVGETPLHCACVAGYRDIASLLIEWNCAVENAGSDATGGGTAFDSIRCDETRNHLVTVHERFSSFVPAIVEQGDVHLLERLVSDHVTGSWPLMSLRSRCIDGSTLLHSAVYFGCLRLARQLLDLPTVDVRLLDYLGATPLHRARSAETVELLLEDGAQVDAVDRQGNTPLHIRAYGEPDRPSEIEAIRLLIKAGARIDATNKRLLTPLHCAAMQGRSDVIEILLAADVDGHLFQRASVQTEIAQPKHGAKGNRKPSKKLPSVVFMSVVNGFVDCAGWLMDRGFTFRRSEPDRLLYKLISGELRPTRASQPEVAQFLIDRGRADLNCDVKPMNGDDRGGYSLLHLAASVNDVEPGLIGLLIDRGADVEASDVGGSETPLHMACRLNRPTAAAALLSRGASISQPDDQGMTPFDHVSDVEEWISTGLFEENIVSELRASDRRQVRRLIRTISDKVRPSSSSSSLPPNPPIIEVSVTFKVKEKEQNADLQSDFDVDETLKDDFADEETDAVTSLSTWCRRPGSASVVYG